MLRGRGERPVGDLGGRDQVYEGLDTLVGKAVAGGARMLEHRLISYVPVEREFSVAEFAADAHREIDVLLDRGDARSS